MNASSNYKLRSVLRTNTNASPPLSTVTSGSKPKRNIDNTATSPLNFVYLCLMFVLKRLIFTNIRIKIGIYLLAILVCSLMKDFNILDSGNYLAEKNNIFNKYFVKLGWAWTTGLLVPFVVMSSLVYTGFNVTSICRHLFRTCIATLIWFAFTSTFEYIDSQTGLCLNRSLTTKSHCRLERSEWLMGFDISGHVFILIHSLLLILEEVNFFNRWENLHKKLESSVSSQDYQSLEWFGTLTPILRCNFLLLAMLVILWEVMLLTTCLFFHTIMHKLVAAVCAIVCWFVTYKMWYSNRDAVFSPGLPADGLF
jgi:hypothetical protein